MFVGETLTAVKRLIQRQRASLQLLLWVEDEGDALSLVNADLVHFLRHQFNRHLKSKEGGFELLALCVPRLGGQ